ncbi:ABC-type antimicrobial peptide transport system permease subunit [Streptomyces pseudovenezuelae]|uniref:ABC-type antimicrobial peptide transport system permease subunit n=1 Tax=Streptomyces pseudovenezuelae TaxID=67350 RepID=A0ABT6M2J3_9ACTN|nr:ABC-type antimicrobial peptide transport system permease subunit [Streptomyces pseudovenezuelae]
MATSQNRQSVNPSTPGEPSPVSQSFLSLHSAVVLLAALLIGIIIGGLTVLTKVPVAAAVIAGMASAGSSVPVLRNLIR